MCYICRWKASGALAHLARAFDWQSKGDEFESRMLHHGSSYIHECDCFFVHRFLYIKNVIIAMTAIAAETTTLWPMILVPKCSA